jgi:CarD family transcriptional regulator
MRPLNKVLRLCYILIVATKKKNTFKVRQRVVYPSQGVGMIKAIENRLVNGETAPYYVVYIAETDMHIMIPTAKAQEMGMRALVSAEEAKEAIESLTDAFEPNPSDWKLRYQMNMELLKKGSVKNVAAIVRSLYHRSKVKELPIQERKLYETAMALLVDEISFSMKKDKKEITAAVLTRLAEK